MNAALTNGSMPPPGLSVDVAQKTGVSYAHTDRFARKCWFALLFFRTGRKIETR
jgi:hypothetical protein